MRPLAVNHSPIIERRERVFVCLAGVFLAAMTLLNVIGITRFIQIGPLEIGPMSLGPLALAVGVLPYPLTFLCTDLISELYGRKRANFVVWVGLFLNLFVIGTLFLGQWLSAVGPESQPPWQVLFLAKPVALPNGEMIQEKVELFHLIFACTSGSVFASMVAYMAAQFCDVYVFHWLKEQTKGKALWLRNNLSTLFSQFIDSFAVISITFGAVFLRGEMELKQVLILMGSNYLFKMLAALVDTVPFYLGVKYLGQYLKLDHEPEVV